ncbi:hypothetical protein KPH14_005609 [Odynerus spinipes]|uniref:Uncharacterized protein n=1 Tax=Odynerus spinipes TaxID=1348599 RepID=A0AAD9VIQ9_9HYME|nr:hypothetical protein KPH14_005609 [Odynerus spinipes]
MNTKEKSDNILGKLWKIAPLTRVQQKETRKRRLGKQNLPRKGIIKFAKATEGLQLPLAQCYALILTFAN